MSGAYLGRPTGSNVHWVWNGSAWVLQPYGGGSAGPAGEVSASYIVLSATSSLANERVLTAGAGISIIDNGPGGTVVVSANSSVASITGSNRVDSDNFDIIIWRMNDPTGSKITNVGTSGSQADLTASANVLFARAGIYDRANEFRGQFPASFATASSTVKPIDSGFSVSTWVYPHQFLTGVLVVKHFDTTTTFVPNSPIVMGLTGSTGQAYVQVRTTALAQNSFAIAESRSLNLADWNHIGFVVSASSILYYQNGDLHYTASINGVVDWGSNGWWAVGGLPTAGALGVDAKLDEVRVANTIRPAEWWREVYVRGLRGGFATGSPGGAQWVEGGNRLRTTASVAISDGTENFFADQKGTDVFFYVSGTISSSSGSTKIALFGGDVKTSGSTFVAGSSWILSGTTWINLLFGRDKELPIVAGTQNTNLGSGSKFSAGMLNFAPGKYISASKFLFRTILAPSSGTTVAYAELFDYNGAFSNGIPGPIVGSVVTASTTTFRPFEKDLTSIFAPITGSGLIEVLIWCAATGTNLEAICKRASIDIEW